MFYGGLFVVINPVKVPECLEVFADGFRNLFTEPGHESFSHASAAAFDNRKTVRGLHKMLSDDYRYKKGRSSYI